MKGTLHKKTIIAVVLVLVISGVIITFLTMKHDEIATKPLINSHGNKTLNTVLDKTEDMMKMEEQSINESEKDTMVSETPIRSPVTVKEPKKESETKGPTIQSNTNEKGQVYDPVFGWIYPSQGDGQAVDSDGDIDKAVGNME